MQLSLDAILKLSSPILTALAGWAVKKYLDAKPKLVTYLVHASAIPLNDEGGTVVNTHSIIVRNVGKQTATNVRIGHNYLPQGFQVFPQMPFAITKGAEESAEILIPNLVPNEQASLSYLYFPPRTWHSINSYTKADHGFAEVIDNIPSKSPSRLWIFAYRLLAFIGASTLVYFAFRWAARSVSIGA